MSLDAAVIRAAHASESAVAESDAAVHRARETATQAWTSLGSALSSATSAVDQAVELLCRSGEEEEVPHTVAASMVPPPTDVVVDPVPTALQVTDHLREVMEDLTNTAAASSEEVVRLSAEVATLQSASVPVSEHQALQVRAAQLEAQRDAVHAELTNMAKFHALAGSVMANPTAPPTATDDGATRPAPKQEGGSEGGLAPAPSWLLDAVRDLEAQAHAGSCTGRAVDDDAEDEDDAREAPHAGVDLAVRLEAAQQDVAALTVENGVLAEQIAHFLSKAPPSLAADTIIGRAGKPYAPRLLRRTDLHAAGLRSLPSLDALGGVSDARNRGAMDQIDTLGANDEVVDLSPVCFDDARALVRRLQELSRLLASPQRQPQQREYTEGLSPAGSKRSRGEHSATGFLSEIETPSHVVSLSAPRLSASVGTLTDPVAQLNESMIASSGWQNNTSIASSSGNPPLAVGADDDVSITAALCNALEAMAPVTVDGMPSSSHTLGSMLRRYDTALAEAAATAARQASAVAQLTAEVAARDATVVQLRHDLAEALQCQAVLPTAVETLAGLKAAAKEIVTLSTRLGDSASRGVAELSGNRWTIEVLDRLELCTGRLAEQHLVLSDVLQKKPSVAAAGNTKEGTEAQTAPASGLPSVEDLQVELESTAAALRQERARAIQALDQQWRMEVGASEARAELQRLRKDYETYVPAADVATIQKELDTVRRQLEAKTDECAAYRTSIDEARGSLTRAEEGYRSSLSAGQARETHLQQQLASEQQRTKGLLRQADDAASEANRSAKNATVLEAQLQVLQSQLDNAEKEALRARGEVEEIRGTVLAHMGSSIDRARSLFPDADSALHVALQHLSALEQERARLAEALQRAVAEAERREAEADAARADAAVAQAGALAVRTEAASQKAAHDAALAQAAATASQAQQAADVAAMQLTRRDADLAAAAERESELRSRVDALSEDPVSLHVRRYGLATSKNLVAQIDEIAAREASVVAERDTLAADLAAQTAEAEALRNNLAERTTNYEQACAARDEATAELSSTWQQVKLLEQSLQAARDEASEKAAATETLGVELEAARATLAEVEEQLAAKTSEAVAHEATVGKLREEILEMERLREAHGAATANIATLEEQITRLVQDNTALDLDRHGLQKEVLDLNAKVQALRTAAASSPSGSRPGGAVRRSLSAVLRASTAAVGGSS